MTRGHLCSLLIGEEGASFDINSYDQKLHQRSEEVVMRARRDGCQRPSPVWFWSGTGPVSGFFLLDLKFQEVGK